jgi:flagellar protein FliL
MSAAAAEAAPPKKSNKKLIIIIAAALAVVLLGGGAAVMMMKKNAAAEEAAAAEAEAEDDGEARPKPRKAAKHDPKAVPMFVPLDSFTVNLADRDAERYAQVGITLELADPAVDAQIKSFMPVIRNNILLALADSTAADLVGRDGKARLARRIQHETSRALGVDVPEEEPESAEADAASTKKKRKKAAHDLPITAVHFSNFIIQ